MKFLFLTSKPDAPSSLFYAENLSLIKNIDGNTIDFGNDYRRFNLKNYDVILFMGYDTYIDEVKKENKKKIVGIIDPRPVKPKNLEKADFLIVNGIEAKDYFLRWNPNCFIYYIAPILEPVQKTKFDTGKLTLGYHGNKVHLHSIRPDIIDVLDTIAKEFDVELWAMYNMKALGKWRFGANNLKNIKIKHIPYKRENFAEYMANVDIGVVPQLMPVFKSRLGLNWIGVSKRIFNEHETDYLMRFKVTTNVGRILIFAQYGIPVITEMAPSSLEFVRDGHSGYIVDSPAAWYYSLKQLASSKDQRYRMGKELNLSYEKLAAPDKQNQRLLRFVGVIAEQKKLNLKNDINFKKNGWGMVHKIQAKKEEFFLKAETIINARSVIKKIRR